MGDDLVTNLDLNQEAFDDSSPPANSPPMLRSSLDQVEGIHDRIRLLEAVSARTRQPQLRRRNINNSDLTFDFMSANEPIVAVWNENQGNNGVNTEGDSTEGVDGERLRNDKRDASHVAKALEMDLDAPNTDKDKAVDDDNNVNRFACHICLGKARDPILTCCGHLFCWGCFYHVPYVDSISRECPICKGEVTDSNIIPIYGSENGENSQAMDLESWARIPPRPQAHRVESIRQQIVDSEGLNNLRSTSPLGLRLTYDSHLLSFISRWLSEVDRGHTTYVSNRTQPVYQERATSVADTSVHIQSEPQEYLSASVLQRGTLATDDAFDVNMTTSPSRRTRGVSRALNLEGESSSEVRRRQM